MSIQHTSDESCIAKPQPIADKWKLFAVNHYFSNELSEEKALALYDALEAADTPDFVTAIWSESDHMTLPWPEYDFTGPLDIAKAVVNLAQSAQETSRQ